MRRALKLIQWIAELDFQILMVRIFLLRHRYYHWREPDRPRRLN